MKQGSDSGGGGDFHTGQEVRDWSLESSSMITRSFCPVGRYRNPSVLGEGAGIIRGEWEDMAGSTEKGRGFR